MDVFRLNIIVTNECNSKELPRMDNSPGVCHFCYRQNEEIETTTDVIDFIIRRIVEYGKITNLVSTGGEPLISEHLPQFLEKTHKKGFFNLIHTNGLRLLEAWDFLEKYADTIFLPLDGSKPEIADYYRGVGFYDITIQNFSRVRDSDLDLGVQTFVSKKNLGDMSEIAELIYQYRPFFWFASTFKRMNRSREIFHQDYEVDDSDFAQQLQKINETYPDLRMVVAASSTVNLIPRLFVHLDGDVYTDVGSLDYNVRLGSLLDKNLHYFIEAMTLLKKVDQQYGRIPHQIMERFTEPKKPKGKTSSITSIDQLVAGTPGSISEKDNSLLDNRYTLMPTSYGY
jgi:MoaA/NifB/PqqE/SkfB family radical SAM enzyme